MGVEDRAGAPQAHRLSRATLVSPKSPSSVVAVVAVRHMCTAMYFFFQAASVWLVYTPELLYNRRSCTWYTYYARQVYVVPVQTDMQGIWGLCALNTE